MYRVYIIRIHNTQTRINIFIIYVAEYIKRATVYVFYIYIYIYGAVAGLGDEIFTTLGNRGTRRAKRSIQSAHYTIIYNANGSRFRARVIIIY